MINLRAIRNYIFLGYATHNQVLTREKKDLYTLIIADETPLGNIERVCQEMKPITLDLEDHHETLILDVINIKHDIILGIS
jgi:hypothetical protein